MSTAAVRRTVILRAQDAPAPTLVIDGSALGGDAHRSACEAMAVRARVDAFTEHRHLAGLGVKTIVLLPPVVGVVRVEFFQGLEHGDLMPGSQEICINSLSCAVTAAAEWYPNATGDGTVLALMSDQSYVVRRR
jgi:hypothetical protein